ncbi:sensor domain-containing diguanylate cyclase [Desulfurispora thermophila]|uniref:sensor domain-containing diguanylate cyclase n=1 Tax=Desulfurispora thermophila TaxID=265470 RepID=UPI0012E9B24A|nr:PAS domain S-box protein [Desulfurispora thermophila]
MASHPLMPALLEYTNDAVFLCDRKERIIYMNSSMRRLTGHYRPGHPACHEVFPRKEENCSLCPFACLASNPGPLPAELELTTARQKTITVRCRAFQQLPGFPPLPGLLVILQNITIVKTLQQKYRQTLLALNDQILKRQKLQEELQFSEKLYRTILDYTGMAVTLIEEDHTISTVNPELSRLSGYDPEELLGRKWDEFVHPEDLPWMQALHVARRTPGQRVPNQYEFRLRCKDGSYKNIFYSISIIPGSRQSVGSMLDITERYRMEKALRQSEEKYRLLVESIEDGFYETDLKGRIVFCNSALCRMLGYTKEEMIGASYRLIVDEENRRKVFRAFNSVYSTGRHEKGFSWELITKEGERRTVEVSISLLRNEQDEPTGFCGIIRDITEKQAITRKLRDLSIKDTLTGLFNRNYFDEKMQELTAPQYSPVSIICCDLDGLKFINDTRGHKIGDQLLQVASAILKKCFRSDDIICRLGGDEFVILLPNTDTTTAQMACRRIKEQVEIYNSTRPEIPVHLSLGTATGDTAKVPLGEIFRQADSNMYKEKFASSQSTRSMVTRALTRAMQKAGRPGSDTRQKLEEFSQLLESILK